MSLSPELQLELEPVRLLLTETPVMVLSTLEADGTPRATPVYFAPDEDLSLVFLSSPESVHSQNLARTPSASAALYPDVRDWPKLRGLQLKGEVNRLKGADRAEGEALYARRFPFVGQLASALASSDYYRFTPSWIRLIDNRRGFGFQQEWSLP